MPSFDATIVRSCMRPTAGCRGRSDRGRPGTIEAMTSREKLHRLVDELSEAELDAS
jgi:hypothetical protein